MYTILLGRALSLKFYVYRNAASFPIMFRQLWREAAAAYEAAEYTALTVPGVEL